MAGDPLPTTAPVTASTRRVPIEHIVVLFQENRTYDALFAEDARGLGDPSIAVDTDPPSVAYKTTPTHGSWWSMRYHHLNEYHARLTRTQVPLLHAWADAYALCDTYHTEKNGPSDMNHISTAVANTDVTGKDGRLQAWIDNPQYWGVLQALGRLFRKDPDVQPPLHPAVVQTSLENAGYSWGVYGDSPFTNVGTVLPSGVPLNAAPQLHASADFATDARAGKLPTVSWLASDHGRDGGPPGSAADGMMWVAEQLQAIVDGGLWEKTAVFITWDDSGGYYDHLPAPDLERLPQQPERPQRLGMRVPCLVVSPWARPGYRSSMDGGLKSHRSLLKFMNEYLGLPPLDVRRESEIDSMWDCFDFDQTPLPPPVTKLSTPLPTATFLQRVGAEARKVSAKFEANMLLQEIATLYVLDRCLGPGHAITRVARRVLGLDTPRTGRFGRQGVPGTPVGWAVYAPLALAGVVPGVVIDAVMGLLMKLGVTGIPSPRSASRNRRYARAVQANRQAGITAPAHSVEPAVWSARTPRQSPAVAHPGL